MTKVDYAAVLSRMTVSGRNMLELITQTRGLCGKEISAILRMMPKRTPVLDDHIVVKTYCQWEKAKAS